MMDRDSSKKQLTAWKFAPAIICFCLVLFLICLPEDSLPDKHSWLDITYLDKFVHAIMFATMTFLFLLPIAESNMYQKVKRHYFIRICISACIWGLATEFIQKYYVPSRSFDIFDWVADSAGITIAWIYCRKFHRR
ncbi:MAG: VanZ family protein [Ferruginibacter sp.]